MVALGWLQRGSMSGQWTTAVVRALASANAIVIEEAALGDFQQAGRPVHELRLPRSQAGVHLPEVGRVYPQRLTEPGELLSTLAQHITNAGTNHIFHILAEVFHKSIRALAKYCGRWGREILDLRRSVCQSSCRQGDTVGGM